MELKENHLPKELKFISKEELSKIGLPSVLFNEAVSIHELKQAIKDEMPAGIKIETEKTVQRFLDESEITSIRENYCKETEEILPDFKEKALQKEAILKQQIKDLHAEVSAIETKIRDLAKQVRIGKIDFELQIGMTYKWVFKDKWVYFSLINDKFRVVSIEEITEYEKESLGELFNESIDDFISDLKPEEIEKAV